MRTRIALLMLACTLVAFSPPRKASKLSIEIVGSDSTAFNVVAAIISGPTEALLWDAQYHVADAQKVAARIAASGKRLKAIIISHPDHDHFAGAAAIVNRFPGTPVYMTSAALAEFQKTGARDFQNDKQRSPELFPDSVITPQVLPSLRLTVDGERVEVIPDLMGDVRAPTNSILWIPSLKTVLASDIVFQDVHPWLAVSTPETRVAWRASLRRIAQLKPTTVIAGHKKDVHAVDSPSVLAAMTSYLDEYDKAVKTAETPNLLVRALKEKFPTYVNENLLRSNAASAVPVSRPGGLDESKAREMIAEGNRAWGAARIAYDRTTLERMLAPDFWLKTGPEAPRTEREAFLKSISTRGAFQLTRFDASVLTMEPTDEGWTAVVHEKLEYDRKLPDGSTTHLYSLWVTRDKWRKIGEEWKMASSERLASQTWNSPPPFPNW
jgi:glyoxylase-like metal-dependent hydrolase (beta-lactamase superfamily II)